jgi:two-component SAPR family response regulator
MTEIDPEGHHLAECDPEGSLGSVEQEKPDIVWLDIEMPGMNGLETAAKIKKVSPDTRLVFVTAFSQYALDAFQVRAQGYIMKPLTTALVRRELDELPAEPKPAPNRLRVQCFGYFEVFWRGEPLRFARRRTKEFLAYLVDRRGAFCAMEDVISALWGDVDDMKNAKHRVRNYISDLRETLKEIDMEDVLIRRTNNIAIRTELLDCDYYRMLEGDMAAVNAFRGEYMTNYSWAELTAGNLYFNTF